jgi:hypothetical protein
VIVTVAEWLVIVDTLRGSLSVADRTDIPLFGYTHETRRRMVDALTERLNEVETALSAGEKP